MYPRQSFFKPLSVFPMLLTCWGLSYCTPANKDQPVPTQKNAHFSEQSNLPLINNPTPDNETANDQQGSNQEKKSYNFDAPDVLIKLPSDLREISGLSVLDNEHLIAVQDEKGKIFSISMVDGKIIEDKRFGQNGDYEGIELVNDVIYVLRSDGDIYRVTDWPSSKTRAKKYETILGSKNDTEGLGYDAANHRLLVVCKENPGAGLKNSRAVYGFDLNTHKLDEQPVLVINLKEIENMTPENPLNRAIRKLASPLTDLSGFKPAALAVHPLTDQIFVVSSVRKLLLAYNKNGTLDDIWLLSEDSFRQPEGLAFLPNGDLFISNEGGNRNATLMRFNYK